MPAMWTRIRSCWPQLPVEEPGERKCTECGAPAELQVTELMRADIRLKLKHAEPRCKKHPRILLRRL